MSSTTTTTSIYEGESTLLPKLHNAITINDVTQVGHLIKKLRDHGRRSWRYGRCSPLHTAAGFDKIEILKLLLASGFDADAYLEKHANEFPNERVTSLMWAAMHNRTMSVKVLLFHGADVTRKGTWLGTKGTAIDFAIKAKNDHIVKLMMAKPEEVRQSTARSSSPTYYASSFYPDPSSATSSLSAVPSFALATSSSPMPSQTFVAKSKTKQQTSELPMRTAFSGFVISTVTAPAPFPISAAASPPPIATKSTASPTTSSSSSDDNLVNELKEVIKRKMNERQNAILKAEVTNSLIGKHEAEVQKLRQSEEFRTAQAIEEMKREVEGLREKLDKVQLLMMSSNK